MYYELYEVVKVEVLIICVFIFCYGLCVVFVLVVDLFNWIVDDCYDFGFEVIEFVKKWDYVVFELVCGYMFVLFCKNDIGMWV